MRVPIPAPSSSSSSSSRIRRFVEENRPRLPLDDYYKLREHLHEHPELSNQESATAATVVRQLCSLGVQRIYKHIGGHGVAAVIVNGRGPVVLLRADMDGLPVLERTGLPYASRARMRDDEGTDRPVMHACGHDVHVAALLAATHMLVCDRARWSGTLVLVFQPAEERVSGARAMVDDGLYDRVPRPDVVLGQHVMPGRAGTVGLRAPGAGPTMSASDSLRVTFFGRGAHASRPDRAVDPVVMAAAAVMRLQTVVAREVGPADEMAVVTVAGLTAGDGAANIIPDEARMLINVRTLDAGVRARVLASVRRIVRAESDASGAERVPAFEELPSAPVTVNDARVSARVAAAFDAVFDDAFDPDTPLTTGSEDFSVLATSVGAPYCYWTIGGTDPALWDDAGRDVPVNHSPFFAPVMESVRVGAEAMVAAAMAFLIKEEEEE